ncbi:MAG: hypothetical protein K2V38_11925, partial [Gemmataceae bacterium]|nr:hypothetical protein [Gemmataceae bacterium]
MLRNVSRLLRARRNRNTNTPARPLSAYRAFGLRLEYLEARDVPAAFTSGNLAVLRLGDGGAALGNGATAVFIDEFTKAGAPVNVGNASATGNPLTGVTASITAAAWSAGTVTVTTGVAHGFATGQQVEIAGMTPTGYNGTYTITVPTGSTTTFTYPLATNPGTATAFGAASLPTFNRLTSSGSATSEGLLTRSTDGQFLVVGGYAATPGIPNVVATSSIDRVVGRVDAAGTLNTATRISTGTGGAYIANNIRSAASADGTGFWTGGTGTGGGTNFTPLGTAVSAATWAATAGGTATITTAAAHGFATGQQVNVAGMTPTGYNGLRTITVTSPTTFTYTLATDPGAATAFGSATRQQTQVSSAPTNTRAIGVFNNQLYTSSGSSPNVGVNTVGTGGPP